MFPRSCLFVMALLSLLHSSRGVFAQYVDMVGASHASELTFGPDGAFWFTTADDNNVGRMTLSGVTTYYAVPTPSSGLGAIISGPDGALWFIETAAGKIGRVQTDGTITEFPVPTPNSQPRGIAAGPDGALWFTEPNASKIGRITTLGAITEYALSAGAEPYDITAGPDGALWFTERAARRIGRITPAGQVTEWSLPVDGRGRFTPYNITAGPDNALYFIGHSEFGLGDTRLARIDTSGNVSFVASNLMNSAALRVIQGPDQAIWFSYGYIGAPIFLLSRYVVGAGGVNISQPIGFIHPGGLAAGPDGAVWFATGANNPSIGRVTYAGPLPAVSSISPVLGPTTGGTQVTISGSRFNGATSVRFGSRDAVAFQVVSASQITATSPSNVAGNADVSVTTPMGTSVVSESTRFFYVALPEIGTISPNAGPVAGNTTVLITGTHLTGAAEVKFGSAAALAYTVVSDTQMSAISPPGGPGAVDVLIRNVAGTSVSSPNAQFTYVARPAITSLSPSAGSLRGGTNITINGTNFSDATAVMFGGSPAASFTIISDTQITAVSPSGAEGIVDVAIISAGGTSPTSTATQFTYVIQPTVTTLTPSEGPTTGNTIVRISGAGFANATAVKFGVNSSPSFTVTGTDLITALSPVGTAGAVDVTVTTAGGMSDASNASRFTYRVPPPVIGSLVPNNGTTVGGELVSIKGANFVGATSVKFGGQAATSFAVLGSGTISAVVPPGNGAVDVTITTPAGTSGVTPLGRYTYGVTIAHDFNADRKSDLAWKDTSGNTAVWVMDGASVLSSAGLGQVGGTWKIVGQRDFDGDYKHDWLWKDADGNVAVWFMNGASVTSMKGIATVGPDWDVVGVGDFNGDGKADILWRNTVGRLAIWLINGTTISNIGVFGSVGEWSVAAVADFDGDGKSDLLWKDSAGSLVMWFMDGVAVTSSQFITNVGSSWNVVATGDLNGDGRSDILWRDIDGNFAAWEMNGPAVTSNVALGNVGGTWKVQLTGDFDGDGRADLLWKDDNGVVGIWFMNGTAVTSSIGIASVGPNWHVQNASAN